MRRAIVSVFALTLMLGCGDDDLKKVARSLQITAVATGELQTAVIELNRTGRMSTDDARATLELCVEINKAGKDAVALTRGIAKLAPEDRTSLSRVLEPLSRTVGDAVARRPAVDDPVRKHLVTIQSALSAAMLVLAVSGR